VNVDVLPTLIPSAASRANGYPSNGSVAHGHIADGGRSRARQLGNGTAHGPPPEAPPRH
jgi:hypothetical protein